MAQNQKLWGRVETVLVTADEDLVAGDLKVLGNWHVVCVDNIADTKTGMGHIRGAFELTKNSASEVIASGDFIEYVSKNKVQKFAAGTKIGKAYEASGNGTATVIVILMPEMY